MFLGRKVRVDKDTTKRNGPSLLNGTTFLTTTSVLTAELNASTTKVVYASATGAVARGDAIVQYRVRYYVMHIMLAMVDVPLSGV